MDTGSEHDRPVRHDDLAGIAADVLGRGRPFQFRAIGYSMAPFIKDGDVVRIVPPGRKPGVGDVVLVRREDRTLLLHRIVRCSGDITITRGDAAEETDDPFPRRNIIGKVADVSGNGYRFHLRTPFKQMIARRIVYGSRLSRIGIVRLFGKAVARMLR